jgi:hypothetical protein
VKLRIRGNSLRLRVTRGEVDALAAGRAVEERVAFPGGATLVYRLAVGTDPERFAATFAGGTLEVALPALAARRWFEPAEVGVRGELPLADGTTLSLLVEKDFPCLTERPGEDDSDAFPWPERASPPRC